MSLKSKNYILSPHCVTIIIKFFIENQITISHDSPPYEPERYWIEPEKGAKEDEIKKRLPFFIQKNAIRTDIHFLEMNGIIKVSIRRDFTKMNFSGCVATVSVFNFHHDNERENYLLKIKKFGNLDGEHGTYVTCICFTPTTTTLRLAFEGERQGACSRFTPVTITLRLVFEGDDHRPFGNKKILSVERDEHGNFHNHYGDNAEEYFLESEKYFVCVEKYIKYIDECINSISEIKEIKKFLDFEVS